jgi:hypothetical protein
MSSPRAGDLEQVDTVLKDIDRRTKELSEMFRDENPPRCRLLKANLRA